MKITVGQVAGFHGVGGEVKVISESDFTEVRFRPGNMVEINGESFEITSYRMHKTFHLLKFSGMVNIDEVEHLKGREIKQEIEHAELELGKEEFHIRDIIGLEVRTDSGEMVGKVIDVLQPGANDVWVVQGESEYMIPYIADVVKEVDLDTGEVIITPMEGLLE